MALVEPNYQRATERGHRYIVQTYSGASLRMETTHAHDHGAIAEMKIAATLGWWARSFDVHTRSKVELLQTRRAEPALLAQAGWENPGSNPMADLVAAYLNAEMRARSRYLEALLAEAIGLQSNTVWSLQRLHVVDQEGCAPAVASAWRWSPDDPAPLTAVYAYDRLRTVRAAGMRGSDAG